MNMNKFFVFFLFMLSGWVIQGLSLNWFTETLVGNTPYLGKLLTLQDISYVWNIFNTEDLSKLSMDRIHTTILKILGLVASFLSWFVFYTVVGGSKVADKSSSYQFVALFCVALLNVFYAYLITVIDNSIFPVVKNTAEILNSFFGEK
ncbi:hypothetical protein [Sutcliffiella horikoshii]|uniref:hypothetical protein n=1 Tax=Sutcliffiella horikoshii TaxID=79883 RepID=UPI0038511C68